MIGLVTSVLATAGAVTALVDMTGEVIAVPVAESQSVAYSVLSHPEGITSKYPLDHATGLFTTLVSSMRRRVPMTAGVRNGGVDYVDVEDAVTTRGADVAALFYVVEDPSQRQKMDYSFETTGDALTLYKRMVTGNGREDAPHNIADIIDAPTSVSVSWDERFAKMGAYGDATGAVYYNDTTGVMGGAFDADAAMAFVTKHAALKWSPLVSGGVAADDMPLVTELAAVIDAVEKMPAPTDGAEVFVTAAITSLAHHAPSDADAARALVTKAIAYCTSVLTEKTNGMAYVEEVRVAGMAADAHTEIAAVLKNLGKDVVVTSKPEHLPHIDGNPALIRALCKHAKHHMTLTQYETSCRSERTRRDVVPEEEDLVWQFQLLFWISVILLVSVFLITCQIGGLDPGRDSIVYRMTPGAKLR